MSIWPGRGNPRKNYSPENNGDYAATSTCPICKVKYSTHSKRSQANAQSGATRQAKACARKHTQNSEGNAS